jgi:hypothetical protein
MTAQHSGLAAGRWQVLSLLEQLADVGSEVERALNWAAKGNAEYSDRALERGLELVDYFWGDNEFGSEERTWRRYFQALGMAAAIGRERAA